MRVLKLMIVTLAVVADVSLGAVLGVVQFLLGEQLQFFFTHNRDALHLGSAFSFSLGPALYVLIRRGTKSPHRFRADVILAVIVSAAFISPILTIDFYWPTAGDVLMAVFIFVMPGAAEAAVLLAVEHFIRRPWSRPTRSAH